MTKKEFINKKIEHIVSIKDSLNRYKNDEKVKVEFRDSSIENDVAHLDFTVTLMMAVSLLDELHRSYEHALYSCKD